MHILRKIKTITCASARGLLCKLRSLTLQPFKLNPIMSEYKIPAQTRIGHVHLKVSDLKRAMDFYCGLLGFELVTMYGDQAAFISAGGYHHHIGLNTWYSKGAGPAPQHSAGLFHTAILYPTRK